MKSKSKFTIVSLLLVSAMIFTLFTGCNTTPPTEMELTSMIASVTPTVRSEHGVEPESALEITLREKLTEKEILNRILVEPSIGNYTLTGSGKNWTITPEEPLNLGKIYNLRSLNPATLEVERSFAFQTRTDLTINATYPMNQTNEVPLDTGIEISFSQQGVDISSYFSIEPAVEGTFKTEGSSATFVPSKPLDAETNYRVVVKAGAKSAKGAQLKEDYTFLFHTSTDDENNTLTFVDDFSSAHGAEESLWLPVQTVYKGEYNAAMPVKVALYSFPSMAAYSTQAVDIYNRQLQAGQTKELVVETQELQLVTEYESTTLFDPNVHGNFIVLPENLPAGGFLLSVEHETEKGRKTIQKMFFRSPHAVYLQVTEQEFLAWVNDTGTAQPVEGAEVSLVEYSTRTQTEEDLFAISASTGADGIATMGTEATPRVFLTITKDGEVLYFDCITLVSPWYRSDSTQTEAKTLKNNYFSALYTDREEYQPTDSVQVWGSLLPRNAANSIPTTVWVSLMRGGKTIVQGSEITVTSNGSFQAALDFENVESGGYSVQVTDKDGVQYVQRYITLNEYVKPLYSIAVKTDKEAYYLGEELTFTVSATYFDGTPVKNRTIQVDSQSLPPSLGASGIALGASGTATISAKVVQQWEEEKQDWAPYSGRIYVSNAGDVDGTYISGQASFWVLPAEIGSKLTQHLEEGKITVETATINQDLVANPEGENGWWQNSFERYTDTPVDIPFTISIIERTTIKTEREAVYDAVNKKNIITYDYTYEVATVETIAGTTENGKASIVTELYNTTEEKAYWAEISYDGGRGVSVVSEEEGVYVPYFYTQNRSALRFFPQNRQNKAAVGETLALGLYESGEVVTNEGTILYTVSQEQLKEVSVFAGSSHSWSMTEEDIPNVVFAGAYFDGTTIHPIRQTSVSYDYSDKVLELSVQADKEQYAPGETAQLSLLLTDRSGAPVQGSVCVGVVDEAVFAVAPQTVDYMAELYQEIYYPYISQISQQDSGNDLTQKTELALEEPDGAMMATGGGVVPEHVRSVFLDTSLFESIETGADGTATVTLPLPDNITSWRITALAVTKEVTGGQQVSQAVVSLPFHVNTSITPTYLLGDDVVIALDGIGTEAKIGEPMEYTITLTKEDTKEVLETRTEASHAGSRLYINFGKLTEGAYKVTVRGNQGEFVDALEQLIAVKAKGLSVIRAESLPVEQWSQVAPWRYPVEVLAFTKEQKSYFDTLQWLAQSQSERSENQVAPYLAERELAKRFGDTYEAIPEPPPIYTEFRSPQDTVGQNGFFALPAGASDPATTAKIAAVTGDTFKNLDLPSYFDSVLVSTSSSASQRAMAYLGHAVLEEPVLLETQRELKTNKELGDADKLYLATALSLMGDDDGAEEVLAPYMEKLTVTEEGAYLAVGDRTKNDEATAAAIMLLSTKGRPEALPLVNYLRTSEQDPNQQVPYTLEIAYFIQNYTFSAGAHNATVTYLGMSGEQVTETLADKRGSIQFYLNQAEFEAGEVSSQGNVEFMLRYRDALAPEDNKNLFTVEKSYQFADGTTVGSMGKVQIRIEPSAEAKSGYYKVNDYIPSGLRKIKDNTNAEDNNDFGYVKEENQKITVYFYYDAKSDKIIEGSYNVSAVLPGEFVTERCALLSPDGELLGISEEGTLVIS